MLALAYANAGEKEEAREALNELLQRDARGEHVVEYRIAAVYEVLGERDQAFKVVIAVGATPQHVQCRVHLRARAFVQHNHDD